jgi:hypothetical protein
MKIVLIVSAVLFTIACCLPALEFTKTQNARDVLSGINVLAVGWSGIFAGVIGWYANPVWFAGLLLAFVGKPRIGAIVGLAALAIGCTTFTLFGKSLPADEGGVNQMALTRTLAGCYVWLASLAALPLVLFFPKGK